MIKFSKTIRTGDVVVKHGEKFIKASRRNRKIVGVARIAPEQQIVLTDGGRQTVNQPAGVIIYGRTVAKLS